MISNFSKTYFKDIKSRVGEVDICLMPIAAWYWRHRHFAPEDAIQAAEDLSCKLLIPILYWQRSWFLSQELSQKWLVGLQLFRIIGGVFLVEMVRGHIPVVFAYPAGIGDMVVGLAALGILLAHKKSGHMPGAFIILVIALGVTDFLSACFFALTSTQGPFQLFFPAIPNRLIIFPTGMIPLFLVPYAIFFHVLSLFNYLKYEQMQRKEAS
jgi:hypothetical protein